MTKSKATLAIENNAAWCRRVWQAHGLPVVQQDALWACPAQVPDFYPNVVTCGTDPEDCRANIVKLREETDSSAFSVKDSFGVLDLEAIGMTCLFEASWLYLLAGQAISDRSDLAWRVVASAVELQAWEKQWDERGSDAKSIFLPALLEDPDIQFWGGWSQGELVAGYISNITGPVVGISNTFGAYDAVIGQAASQFQALSLVTYEAKSMLAEPLALGFEAVGDLKVWISA